MMWTKGTAQCAKDRLDNIGLMTEVARLIQALCA
jgi:hypothetical protein